MAEDEWQRLLLHMEEEQFEQVFCGHTHMPFLREQDGKVVCNVGSVGAPLDGDPRGGWVLVEDALDGGMKISIQRVEYDVARIHQLIDETHGYPRLRDPDFKNAYKKWFSTGIHWKAHL
jgi:predicted phosphodiesterase